jgi:hypothetical protein
MLKALVLTAHARERLQSRKVKIAWIEDTVRTPDWTELDPKDANVERRFRAIKDFGGRVLRVACVETDAAIHVISVMFDRNARRKP